LGALLAAYPLVSAAQTAKPSAAKPGATSVRDPVVDPIGVPTLVDFYAKPTFSHAELSPDGGSVAYVQTVDDVSIIFVRDLKTQTVEPVVNLGDKTLSVRWLEWKDNVRLVAGVALSNPKTATDFSDYRYGNYIFAVDRGGKNLVRLMQGGITDKLRGAQVYLLDRLVKDTDHILVMVPSGAHGDTAIMKVDIHKGDGVLVERMESDVDRLVTDTNGVVTLRYRDYYNSNRSEARGTSVETRPPGSKEWTQIAVLHDGDMKALNDVTFFGSTEKPGEFYVLVKPKSPSEGDHSRLRTYDIATKTFSDPIWPELNTDIDEVIYDGDTQRIAGVCYTVDVSACELSDRALNAHLKGLRAYFGADRDVFLMPYRHNDKWWLLNVSGPDHKSAYYLYDFATKHVDELADEFPQLPPESLAVRERYTFKASDGASIPGYLTRPRHAAKGPLPLIVLPHGGPEDRDRFEYDSWSQVLATRGYLVFQPNFRGSAGYGQAFTEAGHKQWGGRMADDITDGVKSLIQEGQVDPARICIFGGSYGGYAALYAGATHPELYKCVISWAGIADLGKQLEYDMFRFGSHSAVYAKVKTMMGDPTRDADLLKAASPITYAASYKPPVLLIHGEKDDVTP
jgi:dipeptidyl aminopeptidase/acylaminoacyl peptidase